MIHSKLCSACGFLLQLGVVVVFFSVNVTFNCFFLHFRVLKTNLSNASNHCTVNTYNCKHKEVKKES